MNARKLNWWGKAKANVCLLSKRINWIFLSKIYNSRATKIISLVPVLGYVMLWSDKLIEYFKYFGPLQPTLFSLQIRIYLLYFGSFFLLIGFLIHYFFCSPVIKKHLTKDSYLDELLKGGSTQNLEITVFFHGKNLLKKIGESTPGGKNLKRSLDPFRSKHNAASWDSDKIFRVRSENYYRNNFEEIVKALYKSNKRENQRSMKFCGVFTIVGILMFLLPSVEVFLLVMKAIITDIYSFIL